MVTPDPAEEHARWRTAPALEADPRPGTRPLPLTALGALGIDLVECTPERVVARMTVPHGTRGAGRLLVLAESVASTAAGIAAGTGRRAFGAELDAATLGVAVAGTAVATATPLRTDPALHAWRIQVTDAAGVLVLEGRCTLGVVDAPPPAR